jgi:hypothetical protein
MIYKYTPLWKFKRMHTYPTTEQYAQGELLMMMDFPEEKQK